MTRSPLPRPTLLPGLPRLWRGSNTLQVGLDPARAVLIDLPDPRAARMLDLLDGTRPERVVLGYAAELGVAAADAQELLETLRASGLVLPAPSLVPSSLTEDARARLSGEAAALALRQTTERRPTPARLTPAQILRRRGAARVVVAGRGRLGAGIAVALAEAGVRHVHSDLAGVVTAAELSGGPLRAADVGRPRAEAVAEAVVRGAPETQTHPVRRGAASLIVQLGHDQPVALLAASHAQRRQPHLAVTVREGVAVVGPLVPRTGEPCLNCIDLHRRERDPGWPQLPGQFGGTAPEPCGVATVLAATAYAMAEALAFLDGGVPETLGAAVEITAPGRFRRRTWPSHPGCGCARRPRNPSGPFVRNGAKWSDSGG
jgi:ThiF family protein